MLEHSFLPMVFWGTFTSEWHGLLKHNDGNCLSFQILSLDSDYGIPMVDKVFTVKFDHSEWCGWWGLDDGDLRRAKAQGNKVYEIFSRLCAVQGLRRLWVTPIGLVAQGDTDCFDNISLKICSVIDGVLGNCEFHHVPHGEAVPDVFEMLH